MKESQKRPSQLNGVLSQALDSKMSANNKILYYLVWILYSSLSDMLQAEVALK